MKLCNLSFILVNDTTHMITFIRTDFAEVNMVGYLVGFMVFNTLSTIVQLHFVYRGGQFYWLRKAEYTEKTTDRLKVTERDSNSQYQW